MGKSLGGVSVLGGDMDDGAAPAEDTGQEVDVHLGGYRKGEGGVPDDGGLYRAAPEHGNTVHFYAMTVRPV